MVERLSNWQAGALAAGSVLVAGGLASLVTVSNIPIWYVNLHKPGFTPPNWVFAPAWTLLYAMMAIAFWMILRLPTQVQGRNLSVGAFIVQIALNASWSFAFFGFHAPGAALVVIALLLACLLVTTGLFWKLDPRAGALLVPYLAWTSFAALLTYGVFQLNP